MYFLYNLLIFKTLPAKFIIFIGQFVLDYVSQECNMIFSISKVKCHVTFL